MPHTIKTKAFFYDELDEDAQAKARDWYRQDMDFFCDHMYDDFVRVGEILGIDFYTKAVKLMNGSVRYDPKIWWQGFWNQGDGACFEGSYSYSKGWKAKLAKYCSDEDIIKIGERLQAVQKENFYRLKAKVKHTGHYYHEMCTDIDVFTEDYEPIHDDDIDVVKDCLRDFMRWMYRTLEAEYDYQTSEEQVAESIRANEYEFTEDGTII